MYAPDERYGWSHPRSRHFGAACVDALLAVVAELRDETRPQDGRGGRI
jgi:hypothetical protein